MNLPSQLRSLLRHGDRRTIGSVPEIVAKVSKNPQLLSVLIESLFDDNDAVRMRAADAIEKVSRTQASHVQRYVDVLLNLLEQTDQQELCWHLAQILPRLQLSLSQCRRTAGAFRSCMDMRSSIVRTSALQGLTDLVQQDSSLRPLAVDLLRVAERSGTPAMKARSRKLLMLMEKQRNSI